MRGRRCRGNIYLVYGVVVGEVGRGEAYDFVSRFVVDYVEVVF